jgi:hypothetical protein
MKNRYPTSLTGRPDVIDGDFARGTTIEEIATLEEEAMESAIKLADNLDPFGEEENKIE